MSTPAKPFGSSRGDGDSVRSPYAPKRTRSSASDPLHDGLDDPPPPRFLVSSRDGEREQDLTDFSESSLQFRESPLSQSTTRRSAFSERRSYSGSEHARGDSTDDIDLQRLEESVRRLQREAAVSRARPAADEQPSGAADARVQRRRADTYIDGYRVPPSLQPEVLTPPSELREGHGRLWTVMSMLIASAVAAPIAYYFAAGSSSSSDSRLAAAESRPTVETLTVTAPTVPARPPRGQERVDVAAVPEASTVVPRRTPAAPEPQRAERTPPAPPPQRGTPPAQTVERTPPAQAERTPPPAQRVTPPPAQAERTPPPAQRVTPPPAQAERTPAQAERTPAPAQAERTPPPAQRVTPPPAQAERTPPPAQRVTPPPAQNVERAPAQLPVQAPPPPPVQSAAPAPTRTLDPSEIDVLVKQGQQFVAAGDFVTARLVFQRAAEAGNAAAALALGASYDPVVLSRLGVRGVDADVSKARTWYQKAKDFGAPDADRRLNTLANR
jgi:hypothetical protein